MSIAEIKDEREVATILAALRHWQAHCAAFGVHAFSKRFHHFDEVESLGLDELDDLCERLSLGEPEAES